MYVYGCFEILGSWSHCACVHRLVCVCVCVCVCVSVSVLTHVCL